MQKYFIKPKTTGLKYPAPDGYYFQVKLSAPFTIMARKNVKDLMYPHILKYRKCIVIEGLLTQYLAYISGNVFNNRFKRLWCTPYNIDFHTVYDSTLGRKCTLNAPFFNIKNSGDSSLKISSSFFDEDTRCIYINGERCIFNTNTNIGDVESDFQGMPTSSTVKPKVSLKPDMPFILGDQFKYATYDIDNISNQMFDKIMEYIDYFGDKHSLEMQRVITHNKFIKNNVSNELIEGFTTLLEEIDRNDKESFTKKFKSYIDVYSEHVDVTTAYAFDKKHILNSSFAYHGLNYALHHVGTDNVKIYTSNKHNIEPNGKENLNYIDVWFKNENDVETFMTHFHPSSYNILYGNKNVQEDMKYNVYQYNPNNIKLMNKIKDKTYDLEISTRKTKFKNNYNVKMQLSGFFASDNWTQKGQTDTRMKHYVDTINDFLDKHNFANSVIEIKPLVSRGILQLSSRISSLNDNLYPMLWMYDNNYMNRNDSEVRNRDVRIKNVDAHDFSVEFMSNNFYGKYTNPTAYSMDIYLDIENEDHYAGIVKALRKQRLIKNFKEFEIQKIVVCPYTLENEHLVTELLSGIEKI